MGGIYHLDYESATVLTNDLWKRDAGGVPHAAFLLASTIRPSDESIGDPEDEELILLRVLGVGSLPNQQDLIATRMDAMRAATEQNRPATEVVDHLTRGEMQWSALSCRVVGTFYDERADNAPYVAWGSDIDNLYSAARYFVYKPANAALAFIASYPDHTVDELRLGLEPHRIRIGSVRYSSTRRRSAAYGAGDVPVHVRVEDFISMKTAVFGMTRAGKSNTMKIIATAVFDHSKRFGEPIGQLLFDPAGEYANVNEQDQTALRLLGDEAVRIYRFGADGSDPAERPLQVNFYASDQRPAARGLIEASLADNSSAYVARLLAAEIDEPDQADYPNSNDYRSAMNHATRGLFAFYALLAKAEFRVPQGWPGVRASMARGLADRVVADHPGALEKLQGGYIRVRSRTGLRATMDWLVSHTGDADVDNWAKGEPFQAIRAAYDASGGRAVLARLRDIAEFHNPNSTQDHCAEIQAELEQGRIVIVDLSLGSERVTQTLSERIVRYILGQANARFRRAEEPAKIQIFVEEAHRLFDRQEFNKKINDPWVRLAKEAAKFKIGLIYATQEVSSVEPKVLSNTHNWVVAHLNSKREIRELANYYDFEAFGAEIMRSEDRGFVRLKTLSSNFIVPVQVERFGHALINAARATAGLPPVLGVAGVGSVHG
ncbi:MAG: ATP-binding protein [Gammaproteobacteria bacterium]